MAENRNIRGNTIKPRAVEPDEQIESQYLDVDDSGSSDDLADDPHGNESHTDDFAEDPHGNESHSETFLTEGDVSTDGFSVVSEGTVTMTLDGHTFGEFHAGVYFSENNDQPTSQAMINEIADSDSEPDRSYIYNIPDGEYVTTVMYVTNDDNANYDIHYKVLSHGN